jgi:hypothetical protein
LIGASASVMMQAASAARPFGSELRVDH